MALRGNLRDFSLPDVFQLVTFSKKTGVLRIRREDGAEGTVWFRDGEVFFASSNWHSEPLGERLVKAQRITPQALRRGLEMRAAEGEQGRRLGQILVDEGYITDRVLETFVQDQIQDTIFDLMRWDEGDFDFEQMPDVVEEDIGLSVSIENIVMEGSRRLEEWNRIKKKIPSVDVVFKMATAPGEGSFEISLKPMEWNLLQLTDGTRSVSQLAAATHRTDFEVARIVYGLFSAGLLEFATDEEIDRLRAERAEREAKLAVIEAERAAKAAAAKPAEPPAAASPAAPQAAAAPEAEHEVEEPEFLGGASVAPTAEDLSVFEEMMDAVLEATPAEEAPAAVAPLEPRVEPELPFVGVEQPDAETTGAIDFDLSGLAEGLLEPQAPAAVPEEAAPPAEAVVEQLEEPTAVQEAPEAVLLPELAHEPEPEPVPEVVPAEATAADLPPLDLTAEFPPIEVAEISAEEAPAVEPAIPVLDLQPIAEPASEGVLAAEEPAVAEAAETPEAPAAEPDLAALLSYDNLQSIDLAETPAQAEAAGDFETDLMSLGLGEVPPELSQPPALEDLKPVPGVEFPLPEAGGEEPYTPAEEAEESALAGFDVSAFEAPDAEIDLGGLAASLETAPAPVEKIPAVEAGPDFAELMHSLDDMEVAAPEAAAEAVETETVAAAEPSGDFDADLLAEIAAEEPAQPVVVEEAVVSGVISTDAFLEDIGGEGLDMGVGLGDELSALTGAERPKGSRPTASVNKIPEPGSNVLKRDQRVDKYTIMKIIDGIKNL